ncbi:phosphate propanoyltransferase [Azospirillum sp. TSO35-2]|nr:phosphate propanoyltransferase [Azospirillum sp. TSO35-2]
MQLTNDTVERIIQEVLARDILAGLPGARDSRAPASAGSSGTDPRLVPVGVSNRHLHLSRADLEALFGPGAALHRMKAMKQPGQFAAEETVTLKGPKGSLAKVRVLGPVRPETQVEISIADGFALGIAPPLRMSGQLEDTPGIEIIGPRGRVCKERGVIVAQRHIHMPPDIAARLGLRNGQVVDVEAIGERGGILHAVAIRAVEASALELHIDVEEANALCLRNGDTVRILTP